MKHRAPQFELPMAGEPFALAVETGRDFNAARSAFDEMRAAADKAASEAQQMDFSVGQPITKETK
jgi:hypothetical protein